MFRRLRVLCLLVATACSSPARPPATSSTTFDDAPAAFPDLAAFVTGHLFRLDPATAVSLGHHELDGALPDRSPAALADLVAQLRRDEQALLAQTTLPPVQQVERDVLLQEVRSALFSLVDRDVYRRNPMAYLGAINLDAYIVRDYAPAEVRARGVLRLCDGLGAYLAQARANLASPMPRTWIDTALLQTKGYREFAHTDVRKELAGVPDQAALERSLAACTRALDEHAAWLTGQQPRGTHEFALGETAFLKMLAQTQSVETDLATLRALAERDLRRNLAAIEAAARQIDASRPVAEVVRAAARDQPAATEVLAVATEQAASARAFVLAQQIASIPSDEVAVVRESPPFQRWNAAFLDSPGPFEQRKLPSYYYISPPDPAWPLAEQQAYLPPRADLMFTTVHEVWPGHFLHGLHIRANRSKVLQSFCTYSNSEGWAHYAEEMMFDAGFGGATPQARIGMLKEALLRNVRFVVALGLHTGGMTVEQAQRRFETDAFVDPGNARQQAVRGTFDPMFLSYTLGKLMIRELREQWLARHPGGSLRAFHDELLGYACAPLPVIRRAMLGPDAGPALR